MVDVLPNISDHFRERFLDTHLDYLHSILYIIQKMYFEKDESPPEAMLNKILKQRPKIHKIKKDRPFETSEFRNLRNCWYYESALNYPFDSLDERMKFASWKIMQCYYTRANTVRFSFPQMRIEKVRGRQLDALINFEPPEKPSQPHGFLAEGNAFRLVHVQELAYATVICHKPGGFILRYAVPESS